MAALSGPPPDSDRPEIGSRSWIVSGIDPSTVALIATNIGVLVLALYQQWDFGTVIWIYWFQSVIIGFFQRSPLRIIPNTFFQRYCQKNVTYPV